MVPETFSCVDCGEEYRGFHFFQLHCREEHAKEADFQTAKRANTSFVIYAGARRNSQRQKADAVRIKVVKLDDDAEEDPDDITDANADVEE